MLHENKRFKEYLVDFTYALVDVNNFSSDELYNISNAISLAMFMDQMDVSADAKALTEKLDAINDKKEHLPARHIEAIIEFISVVISAKYDEFYSEQIKVGLDGKLTFATITKEAIQKSVKEGKSMTYAIEILMDSEREKSKKAGIHEGIEQGIEQEKHDVARTALLEGASVEFVAKITKLEVNVINDILKEIEKAL